MWPGFVVARMPFRGFLPSQVSFEPPSLSSRKFTLSRSFGLGFGPRMLALLLWSSAAAAKDSACAETIAPTLFVLLREPAERKSGLQVGSGSPWWIKHLKMVAPALQQMRYKCTIQLQSN